MSEKRAFVTLDGLRGIAALAVVTRHAPNFFDSIAVHVLQPNGSIISVGPFFESYLAVDFFFALSGFVLAHAYGDRLRKGMSAARFMTVRMIRLYPLYFVALLVSAVVAQRLWAHGHLSTALLTRDFIFGLLFLPTPNPAALFPLNAPAWSLFDELLANTLFGVIGKRLNTTLLVAIVSATGLTLLYAVNQRLLGFASPGRGAMDAGFEWTSIGAGVARVSYSFFAGILIYRIWKIKRPKGSVPPLLVVIVLGAILAVHPPQGFQTAFDLVSTIIVFPCLIYIGASSRASGVLARAFTWFGLASYAIYVLQAPLYRFILLADAKLATITKIPNPFPSWLPALAFVVFAFIVAVFCDKYIDRPVREFATRLLVRPTSVSSSLNPPITSESGRE